MSGFASQVGASEADLRGEENASVNELTNASKVVFSSTLQPPLSWANTRLVSGDADVRDIAGQVNVQTTSGDVDIKHVRGALKVHSISGDLEVRQSALSGFDSMTLRPFS